MQDVYIVKNAIVTGLGNSLAENWAKLLDGCSAIDIVDRFQTEGLSSRKASCTTHLPAPGENRVCALVRDVLSQVKPVPSGTGIVWAGIKGGAEFIETGRKKEMPYLPEHYRQWVAEILGIANRGFEVNAACASSTVGMALGALKIARGEFGAILVCAADVVTAFVFNGFSALKALTPSVCRPFDRNRNGMSIGDGAVAILLADAATARKHNLERLARVSGWGISNDANHITGPARDGSGLAVALETALNRAAIRADDVQAYCAHGTGTVFNDAMELAAIKTTFGDRRLPVFSVKGAVGHTLGAAGGIDASICVRALSSKRVPPTVGLKKPEKGGAGRVANQAQFFGGQNILTSNSGFGGVNAAVFLSAVPS